MPWLRRVWAECVVFAVALGLRLAVAPMGGGYRGRYVDYDTGVYYAAATGLVHGKVPYRDFVLVHPPVIAYALAPFAALGRLTSDHAGYLAANFAFAVIGAVNAVLVVLVARRAGFTPVAAVIGGGFYATWYGAVEAEYLCRLEGLGNLSSCSRCSCWAARSQGAHRGGCSPPAPCSGWQSTSRSGSSYRSR